jgi:hypothetical protein
LPNGRGRACSTPASSSAPASLKPEPAKIEGDGLEWRHGGLVGIRKAAEIAPGAVLELLSLQGPFVGID